MPESETQALIYCRVSSTRQVREGHGLSSQESRCREFAARKGYAVAEVFRDEGVSGGLIDRPGMQAMLAFLKKRRANGKYAVIIDDISRLARDIHAHIQLRTAIQIAGGKLESPSIEFGTDPDSVLVEHLLASVSQHQRQKNAEQVKNRMRARVLAGYWVFSPPVGFRYNKVAGHGSMLVPDEPVAGIVRDAIEGFASGRFQTPSEVKRYVETFPAFPRNGYGEVSLKTVLDMLARPLNAGYITVEKWGIHLHPGKHQPLIAFETWRKAQKRLRGDDVQAPIRMDTNGDFPLRGFITCTCCGHPMTAAWSKGRNARYPYYECQQRGCAERRRSIRRERVHAEFETLLNSVRPSGALFGACYAMLRDLWEERLAGARQRARDAKAEIARLEQQSVQLMDRIVQTDSPALITAYETRLRTLEEEKLALVEQDRKRGAPQRSFEETFRTACAFLANPCKLWLSDRLEHKRMVLRLVFGGHLPYSRSDGFRTAILTLPFKALAGPNGAEWGLVEPRGIEPLTSTMPL
ncbi:recombinase family protein [Roseospira goensis]|uniref:recombinase family protein n=1 Tax=Roseospira goensis TaxID=391922 RepID=UPI0016158CF0